MTSPSAPLAPLDAAADRLLRERQLVEPAVLAKAADYLASHPEIDLLALLQRAKRIDAATEQALRSEAAAIVASTPAPAPTELAFVEDEEPAPPVAAPSMMMGGPTDEEEEWEDVDAIESTSAPRIYKSKPGKRGRSRRLKEDQESPALAIGMTVAWIGSGMLALGLVLMVVVAMWGVLFPETAEPPRSFSGWSSMSRSAPASPSMTSALTSPQEAMMRMLRAGSIAWAAVICLLFGRVVEIVGYGIATRSRRASAGFFGLVSLVVGLCAYLLFPPLAEIHPGLPIALFLAVPLPFLIVARAIGADRRSTAAQIFSVLGAIGGLLLIGTIFFPLEMVDTLGGAVLFIAALDYFFATPLALFFARRKLHADVA